MKIKSIAITTFIIISVVSVSCKKEKPEVPVNAKLNETTACASCPTTFIQVDSSNWDKTTYSFNDTYTELINNSYISIQPFIGRDGSTIRVGFNAFRTPHGFFGDTVAIEFNVTALNLTTPPTQVSFTRFNPRLVTNDSNLVNIKFTNTPLIVTSSDSLGFYLEPYGYTVRHYYYDAIEYYRFNKFRTYYSLLDSVVITGTIPNNFRIGVKMYGSELRNICFK